MELDEEQAIEECFQKCGEALISLDHTMFALNCCFCMAVFMQLDKFQQHILEVHLKELAEGFAVNTGESNHEEYAVKDADCADDMEMFIAGECIVDGTMETMEHSEGVKRNESELIDFAEMEINNNAQNVQHLNVETEDDVSFFDIAIPPEAAALEVFSEKIASFPVTGNFNGVCEGGKGAADSNVDLSTKRNSIRIRKCEKNFLDSLTDNLQFYPELWKASDPSFSNKELRKKATQKLIKRMQNEYPRRIIRPKYILAHIRSMKDGFIKALHAPKKDEPFDKIEQQADDSTTSMIVSSYEPCNLTDLHLVKLYEQQPCLWSLQHSKFSDKATRRAAYTHIITELKRLAHTSERPQLKVNKLRLRIAQLCDWYKAQLRSQFRCKMLGEAFVLNHNELLFKQFEFLLNTFKPSIEEEEEFKVRDEVEAQYLQQHVMFPNEDSDSKSLAESSAKISSQACSDVEDHAAEIKKTTLDISCSNQDRIETTRLIETYRKFPVLWNPNISELNPFKAKRKAYENIAKILTNEYLIPMSSELVRQKLKNLRQQYKDYLKKKENGINSKLWYIPLLSSFLKDHINSSLRRGKTKELEQKMPSSLDLPFRFEKNMPLNLHLIEVLHNSPSIWQSKNLTFQLSTKLLQNTAFPEMLQELNTAYGLQLDDNNLLFLLHDLCEWFKREKARQQYCNNQEPCTQITFVPSSAACWDKMQFLADYTFLPAAYSCIVCERTTNSIHGYLIDRCSHASLPPHKCFYCDKRFVDITNRRTHECRIHSKIFNYTCEYCDKKFAHATDELIHRRRFHTQERPFVCEICGKSFVASYDMKRHRNLHLQKQDFKCNICSLNFYERSELQLHKLHKHSAPQNNKICKKCGCCFPTDWKLKKHLQVECKQKAERLTRSLHKYKGQTRNKLGVDKSSFACS